MKGTPGSAQSKSRYGKPSLLIKQKYPRAALKLLIEATTVLQAKKIVNPKTHENDITYRLDSEMKKMQIMGKDDLLFWNVRPMHEVNDPLERGELDIKFQWSQYPPLNDRYLGVEAKRLFGTGPSTRSSEYVTGGIMDFITCKYSRGHNYGIMLGYVLVGPFNNAIEAVSMTMTKRKIETAEYSAFAVNNSLSTYPYTYHSIHIQQGTSVPITLIHLFFDFS